MPLFKYGFVQKIVDWLTGTFISFLGSQHPFSIPIAYTFWGFHDNPGTAIAPLWQRSSGLSPVLSHDPKEPYNRGYHWKHHFGGIIKYTLSSLWVALPYSWELAHNNLPRHVPPTNGPHSWTDTCNQGLSQEWIPTILSLLFFGHWQSKSNHRPCLRHGMPATVS